MAADSKFLRRVALGVVTGILILLFTAMLLLARHLVLLLFAAVLLAVLLRALARPLHRYLRIPPRWAVLAMSVALIGTVIGLSAYAGPQIGHQLGELMADLPGSIERLRGAIAAVLPAGVEPQELLPEPDVLLSQVSRGLKITVTTAGAFGSVLVVLVGGFFVAMSPDRYARGLLRLVPPRRRREVADLGDGLRRRLERWLLARLVAMMVIGVGMTVGLLFIGVPFALVLGVIAGGLAFIPYVGALLAALPMLLMAWTVSGQTVLHTLILYLVVQLVETHVLTPLLEAGAVALPAGLIMAAQLLLTFFTGVIGILVATPMLLVVLELVRHFYVESALEGGVPVEDETLISQQAH